jgi:glycosyltransferase involved in cell wall biosynthesis
VAQLVLVANARLPSQRAQSLQVVQAAGAFARQGVATTLVHARRRHTPALPGGQDLQDYYGVPPGPRADVVAVGCVDWIDAVPRALQYLPARLQELSFSRSAAAWVRGRRPEAFVLSREVEAARGLLAAGQERVFLEVHRVPGGRARRAWLLEVARAAGGLIAISGGVRDDLLALGVEAARVRVEHDAYDPARFARLPTPAQARARLDVPPEAPLVVYTGGLLDWKGVEVLVEAARRMPAVRFLVAGGMPADVERVRALAAGLDNVRLDGFQPPARVADYLAAADVLAVPNRSSPAISARYTSPLKVFEAMAVGKPVVASDLPSLRELLTHDRDAWLVPPDDPQALAHGVGHLLADAALRGRLGAALAARGAEHTWDARARRLLDWMGAAA